MKFTMEIALGNDAMQTTFDIAEAMRYTARGWAEYEDIVGAEPATPDQGRIYDNNGNHVGSWHIIEDNARTKWSEIDTMPPSMIETPVSNITERAAIRDYAFHRDGEPCIRAMMTLDCTEGHLYGRTFETSH